MTTRSVSPAWYREPWPWILMSGPALVIVAGAFTMWLAVTTSDGLVADDYYKQGLGINRVLARDERAASLGVMATVQFAFDHRRVRVSLPRSIAQPEALRATLLHPTRAGGDQAIALAAIAPGLYEGAMRAPHPGAWRLVIEDAAGTWRLAGDWTTREPQVTLDARR